MPTRPSLRLLAPSVLLFYFQGTATLPSPAPRRTSFHHLPVSFEHSPKCLFVRRALGPSESRGQRERCPGSLNFSSMPWPHQLDLGSLPRGLLSDAQILRLTLKRGGKPSALPASPADRPPSWASGSTRWLGCRSAGTCPALRVSRGHPSSSPCGPPVGVQAPQVGSFSRVPFPDSRRWGRRTEEGRPGPGKDESWCCLQPSGRPEEPARKPVSGRRSPSVLRKTKRAVMPQPLVKFASVKVAPVQTPRAAESLWTWREAGASVSPASV